MKHFLLLLSVFTILGCKENQKKVSPENEKITEFDRGQVNEVISPAVAFAQNIEAAHNIKAWKSKKVVSFDIDLSFGGEQRLMAKITSLTNSTALRVDKKDGSQLIYNGKVVF